MFNRILFESCPICGNTETKGNLEADCTKHPLYQPRICPKINWLQCAKCEHIYTDGYHTDEALNIIFQKTNDNQKVGFDFENQRAISARIIDKILQFSDHGTWCDIGFGNGSLLLTAKEYGFFPIGIDLRQDNVNDIKQLGVEAHSIDFTELSTDSAFSIVSMCDVIEHIPYPRKILEKIYSTLEKDGLLFFSLPNADSTAWQILDAVGQNPYWGELEHYHNFGKQRFYRLLKESGFEPVRYGVSERYRLGMEVIARKLENHTVRDS